MKKEDYMLYSRTLNDWVAHGDIIFISQFLQDYLKIKKPVTAYVEPTEKGVVTALKKESFLRKDDAKFMLFKRMT